MRKIRATFRTLLLMIPAVAMLTACDDNKSYAELLSDETKCINAYLADQTVIGDVPADSIFVKGIDAPYYRMDEEGNVYMRVIKDDPKGVKAKYNDLVYMRFTRHNLYGYSNGTLSEGDGNASDALNTFSFRFQNLEISSSAQWGEGLQVPLKYLHYNCEVELVIRSAVGLNTEIASVVPYLYKVRYYKSNL